MTVAIALQFAVVFAAIWMGARYGGIGRIGRYVLNHSFMVPGLVATCGAVATGLLLARRIY